MKHTLVWLCLCAAVLVAGCRPGPGALERQLTSDHPRQQAAAIARIARRNETEFIPRLIELLGSDDEGVRFMAAAALHKMTDKNFGFHRATSDAERIEVRHRWEEWLEEEGRQAYDLPPAEKAEPTPADETPSPDDTDAEETP